MSPCEYRFSGIHRNGESSGSWPGGHLQSSATVLVFLHGWSGSSQDFLPIMERLPFPGISLDLPGHGENLPPEKTPFPRHCYYPDSIANALSGEILSWGFPKLILVGYSMGGRIAVPLALMLGKSLSGLVLESAGLGIPDPTERKNRRKMDVRDARKLIAQPMDVFFREWYSRGVFHGMKEHPDFQDFLYKKSHITEYDAEIPEHIRKKNLAYSLVFSGNAFMPYSLEAAKSLEVPILYISGEQDKKYTALGASLAGKNPRVEHRVVPGASHNVHAFYPEEYSRLLEGIVRKGYG